MEPKEKIYCAIDLKSFYASVECVERGLDPLNANLVVADESRTEKTICLAVSPALKKFGIPGRPRLFEVLQKVKQINAARRRNAPGGVFSGKSIFPEELEKDPSLELDFVIAMPRMAKYMEISKRIYGIYLRHVAPEDMHVYSVDEVFIDMTDYLPLLSMTPREFTVSLIREVYRETGITATAGIAPNMFLCKVAMDVKAKRIPADKDGVRIAELSEASFRREFWSHRPLTDFWRIGKGYAAKLEQNGMFTLGDVARCSLKNEALLYRLFGINAELLIDHSWGVEPCTIRDIQAYKPECSSISTGQVLSTPYPYDKARLVVREMADLLVLDLVKKGLVTNMMELTVNFDAENLKNGETDYRGAVTDDRYGRRVPKEAHGNYRFSSYTSSTKQIVHGVLDIFDRTVHPSLTVRAIYVVAANVIPESDVPKGQTAEQLDFFTDYDAVTKRRETEKKELEKEKKLQKAEIAIKEKFGNNAIVKGMNFEEGATAMERNRQIGGHKA